MNINLRDAIITRMQDKSNDELTDVVEGSIGGDDRALPGLGVLFEIIWEHSDKKAKTKMISTLKEHLAPDHAHS
jgi:small acid-soluble spore protein I (minor)